MKTYCSKVSGSQAIEVGPSVNLEYYEECIDYTSYSTNEIKSGRLQWAVYVSQWVSKKRIEKFGGETFYKLIT
jgi:hypothetical protein